MYPIDHIGIATQNIDSALAEYGRTFGFALDSREIAYTQNTEVAFLRLANTKIELLAPYQNTGPIEKFLQKRGPGLHHICYKVEDIEAELARFAALGHELIDKEPRPGAHNTRIAFIYPKGLGGVLTELCEYP